MVYLKILMVPIDNNACERGFKPLVKGRKTSLFFQNLMGAWRASMMYSFFETCAIESPESSAVVDVCAEQHQDHAGGPVAEPAAAEL